MSGIAVGGVGASSGFSTVPLDCIVLERIWPPRSAAGVSACHIGGWPNLPAHIAWPRVTFADRTTAALDFLAQIDLASLPNVPARGLLPADGTLYFFALSQTPYAFDALGDGAYRVIYEPQAALGVPLREPPADAGWGQGEIDYARTEASLFRRTDGPRGELHPYCPVVPKRLAIAAAETIAEAPRRPQFTYDRTPLPLRVEDALLTLYYTRNCWFENILPLDAVLDFFKRSAESHRRIAARPNRQGKTNSPAAWAQYLLSADGVRDFVARYERWRERAVALTRELTARGRATLLTDDQRARVLSIFADGSVLNSSVNKFGFVDWRPDWVAALSLTELLLHDPGLTRRYPQEVAAARPDESFEHHHKMFGPGRRVQNAVPTDPETVVLLQLESESLGPRFLWWDCGNLTFWMSAQDAANGRFDRIRAEIEGH